MPTVLIIETEPSLLKLLVTTLRLFFPMLFLLPASSIEQAVYYQKVHRVFDLVILDVDIPRHREVFQALARTFSTIILSHDDTELVAFGQFTCLRKPFHLFDLQQAVKNGIHIPYELEKHTEKLARYP